MEKLYKSVLTAERNPSNPGWYDTDKGNLYFDWWGDDQYPAWSCREDRISEEYPKKWYEPFDMLQPQNVINNSNALVLPGVTHCICATFTTPPYQKEKNGLYYCGSCNNPLPFHHPASV